MNSRKYWERRAAQDMYDRMGTAESTAAEMNAAIQQTSAYLEKEVRAVLRGMQSFGISEAEARKILSASGDGTALQRLRKSAQQVSDPEKREALLNAINSAGAYRYRITRIEELNKDIVKQCRELYKTENQHITSALGNVAEDSYYREIFSIQKGTGLGFSFSKFSQKDVDRILRANWSGGNYSQRIWKDVNGMTARLKSELLVSMLSGRSNEKTARIFQEQFGVNAFCARRIVRTESAYVANAAQSKAYDEAGIDRYRFVATLDSRTCECCAALDGKVFELTKAKPGTNYPPMHPFCRSTTIADFGDEELAGLERRAKDKDGNTVRVPAGMTYEDWHRKFVEGEPSRIYGSVKPKKTQNAVPVAAPTEKPVDIRTKCNELRKQYNAETQAVEKMRKEFKELEAKVYFGTGGTADDVKRLQQMNAEIKLTEERAAAAKNEMLGAQKEYADAACKRLVDNGIFKSAKLPKTITPAAVDEIESKAKQLYSEYGIMPQKLAYDPMKTGPALATYSWTEEVMYIGNGSLDPEKYAINHKKTAEALLTRQNSLRTIYEKQVADAENILSDKSIKGYERWKAQLNRDRALVELNKVRNTVPDNIGEVFEHEYGHFLHDTANRMSGIYDRDKLIGLKKLHGNFQTWSPNDKSGQVAASTLSSYATESPLEAIAEAFVAKRKGYDVPKVLDDVLSDIERVVRPLDKSGRSGIIKLSSKFVNPTDPLYTNANKIKPVKGYGDIIIHGSPDSLLINGLNGEQWEYGAKEAAEMIRNSREFHGQPIRLVACQTGAKENGIAQQIADELGVDVMAPTEIVSVDIDGEMFVCDNDVIATTWGRATEEERKKMIQPGGWKVFSPRKER